MDASATKELIQAIDLMTLTMGKQRYGLRRQNKTRQGRAAGSKKWEQYGNKTHLVPDHEKPKCLILLVVPRGFEPPSPP